MDARDSNRQPPPRPVLLEATFANSAASPSDVLLVTVDAFGEQPFGDPDGVVWSPMGGALPQEGDRALVAESDDGSWWVTAWWSANQSDGAALSARVTALEAETGGKHWASGTVTITGTGATSASTTVTHGLSFTPAVLAGSNIDGFTTLFVTFSAITSTQFTITARDSRETVWSGGRLFSWIATD